MTLRFERTHSREIRMPIMQEEARASADQRVIMSTVLGSCVATCLYDPVARIGGMNHFLLAEPPEHETDLSFDSSYGLFLMELLVNEMLKLGALKSRMTVDDSASMRALLRAALSANGSRSNRPRMDRKRWNGSPPMRSTSSSPISTCRASTGSA